ncbi:phage tail tape measure protein, partial [Salinivibrio sp. VYel6]|uniref:phage tail tape measure protein n=1 Tax=Salinivibrio sp. VYel6 TaxID=2490493 RepID=UPI00128C4E3F
YKRTQKTLADLQAAMKKTSGDGLKPLQREAQNAERKMQQLDDELRRGQQAAEEFRIEQRKSKSAVSQLTSKKIKQIQKTRNLRSELRKAGVNTRDFANEQKRLEAASEKTSAQLDKQSKRLKEMQAIQGRIDGRKAKLGELGGEATGLAMKAAPIAASIFTAIKNESSFADVKKVRDMSPEQAAELRSWALKTSEKSPMSANQINQLMAAGARTGIKSDEDLKQFVLDANKMGVAFDMDAAEAGKTLSVFKSSMGLDQKGAMNLAGLANYLDNNTNAQAKDIAGVMSRQGATAKSAGFSVNEATALSASLLSFGMGEE